MNDIHQSYVDRVKGSYRPRVVDDRVSELLRSFGGVVINGPRMCGKSWTGINHSNSALFIDNGNEGRTASLDPEHALDGEEPRLIDEWQNVPELWDIARRRVDFINRKGMYVFTGSSVPPEGVTSHSGTGRFANVRMRTLSLFESGESSGAVSLRGLFEGSEIKVSHSKLDYRGTVKLICRGGWPAALGMDAKSAESIPYDYLESVISMDYIRVDGKSRKRDTMDRVLRSLARNVSTTVKMTSVVADASDDDGSLSPSTVRDYVDALEKIYVIENQYAWNPAIRSRVRIRRSPKVHFTDPSLAVAALNVGEEMLYRDPNTAGFLFESLCYRDLCVYSSSLYGKVYHYRDNSGLEVDSIVQLRDGRWGAVEVKMGVNEFDKAAENLLRLKAKMAGTGVLEPSFLMILNAVGGVAHRRPDGVTEVPLDCLGP